MVNGRQALPADNEGFNSLKGMLMFHCPGRKLTPSVFRCQRGEYTRVIREFRQEKRDVTHESEEGSDICGIFRYGPLQNFVDLRSIGFDPAGGNVVSKEVQLQQIEVTLPGIAVQLGLAQGGEDHMDVFGVLLDGVRPNDDVIKVYVTYFT